MADKKKKRSGLTIACVVLVVLVCFIILLVKKDTIITNLKETNFFERVFGSNPEFVENHKVPQKERSSSEEKAISTDSTVKINVETEKKQDYVQNQKEPAEDNRQKTEKSAGQEKIPEETTDFSLSMEKSEKENLKPETVTTEVPITELQLCFVEIVSEGSLVRKIVKRSIPKNDSPLSTAIKLLLKGPDMTIAAEKNCQSFIPEGTELLGIKIQNGTAYIDFSEDFEINTFGVEGYNAQLMQVVYTATSFPTVKSVQFLIEGRKKEYLGSEGQWIGSPLTRNAF